jgi:hypothetical protein
MSPKAGAARAVAKSALDWNRNQVVLPTLLLLLYSRQINPKPENVISWRDPSATHAPGLTVPSPRGNCPGAELCTNKIHCLLVLLVPSTRVLISAAYSVFPMLYSADGKMIMDKKKTTVAN